MLRERFWEHHSLESLNQEEWEALCDGCALCCLHKLEDEDTGEIAVTDLCCKYLDMDSCQCGDYANRHKNVPDCVPFNADRAKAFYWLPDTCAYRCVAEQRALPEWHYLISGDREAVHRLGVSASSQGVLETSVPEDEWQDRVVRWVDSPT